MISRSAAIYTSIAEFGDHLSGGLNLSLTLGLHPEPALFSFRLTRGNLRLASHNPRPPAADYAMVRDVFEPVFWALQREFDRLAADLLAADRLAMVETIRPVRATYGGLYGDLRVSCLIGGRGGSDWLDLQSRPGRQTEVAWATWSVRPPRQTDYQHPSKYAQAIERWNARYGPETLASLGARLESIVAASRGRLNAILPAGINIPL